MPVGAQIKKRRNILGLTLQQVVDRLNQAGTPLSKAAISKYERGASTPRATHLRGLATALECSYDYLLSEPKHEIKWLRFRKKTSMTKRVELEIKQAATEWLSARQLVDDAIGRDRIDFLLPSVPTSDTESSEAVAERVRQIWDIGMWPIETLTLAIEKSGVFVVEVESDGAVDGLSGIADDSIPFVVVASGAPTDRLRMNLAHELGHIVIKSTGDEKQDEKRAFRFGAALLMPREVLIDRIGRRRMNLDLRELFCLKEEYGISVQALVRRAFDVDIVSEWTYKQLNIELRSKGWHREEPGDRSHLEHPNQFRSDLLHCISEGFIAESMIRSLFPAVSKQIYEIDSESRWKWTHLGKTDASTRTRVLEQASAQAAKEYQADGSLSGFEIIDEND